MSKVSVNFFNTTSDKSPIGKMIKLMALEMGKFYHMTDGDAIEYFVRSNGQPDFLTWVKENHGVDLIPYRFQDNTRIYAYGFLMEESEALTAAILKYCGA